MSDDDCQEITETVLRAFYLYGGYQVKSRGPSGLLLDVLKKTAPEVHRRIQEGEDIDDIYRELYPSTDGV